MSAAHGPEHERAIAAAFLGEVEGAAHAVATPGCAACERRLAELRSVVRLLERAADGERAAVADAAVGPQAAPPSRDPIERLLSLAAARERAVLDDALGRPGAPRDAGATVPTPTRAPFASVAGRIAAAAALLAALAAGWWVANPGSPAEAPIPLSAGDLACAPARDAREPFRAFAWSGTLPAGGWFEVAVRDAQGIELLERSGRLHVHEWSPEADRATRWPDEILWEVHAYDATGSRVGSCSGSRSR